jgi:hypothetical protein
MLRGTMFGLRYVFGGALLGLVAGCGSGGVHYSGHTRPSIARPSELREFEALPEGYERIGKIGASCTLTEGKWPRQGGTLADVDCSETRLMTAILERAAEVGGEALIAEKCRSRVKSEDQSSVTLAVSCRAGVARPSDETLARRPLVSEVLAEDGIARAGEAWRIRVRFTPKQGVSERPPRHPDSVREVPLMPLSDVELGDIVTSCKCGCSEEGAREGLMAAAGRFGASDVVDLHCAAKGRGFVCTAVAATYEVDPELDARAR